jgi:hypothetical protein
MSAPSFVRAAFPYKATVGLIATLFEGITLSPQQDREAREIISRAIDTQLTITLRNTDGWDRVMEVHAERDAGLRELLNCDRDRTMFDGRSTELRRRQAEQRPLTATAPVVLRVAVVPISGGTLELVFRADGMADEATEAASWQIVNAFHRDAEQLGVLRISAIADVLERRDEFATYARSITRTFGRQSDGAWIPVRAG